MVDIKTEKYSRSLIEDRVFSTAGEKGVELFRLADGRITLDEAAAALGIKRNELDELITKLEGKFIHVEYEKEEEERIEKEKFEEMVEPIDVPKKVAPLSFGLKTSFTLEFGPSGSRLFDAIDGTKDILQLSLEAGVTLPYADAIVWWLAKRGILHFKQLTHEDVKNRYGSIGLQLFDKYGREGIYLYLLLEKYVDATSAIRASGVEPEKAVEIMSDIFELLAPPFQFDKRAVLDALRR
jgi:hypothetical protein